MPYSIPMHKNFHDRDDVLAVTSVVERGMYWANGPEIEALEKELASYTGRKYALAFCNGTAALHAMLLAYGIKKGDEVIVPSFTFIATSNSVLFCGAKPVFADIEKATCALDPDDVRKKITAHTKAIMPIHFAGMPASKILELQKLAKERGLYFFEDAAESLGAKFGGRAVGSFSDAAVFSFCANKVIASGEGGAVVTDSKDIFEKLKLVRSHGRAETENYFESTSIMDYVALGYNYRMPSIVAALALSQMKKIEKIILMRRNVAAMYAKGLARTPGVTLPPDGGGLFNVYQLYTIRLGSRKQRDGLKSHLDGKGIMSKVYFSPVHQTYFYKNTLRYDIALKNTEEMSERALSLPIFPSMGEEEVKKVCGEIIAFLEKG